MRIVLIQKHDMKSVNIMKAISKHGIEMIPTKGSPMLIPCYIVRHIKRIDGLIFRYLNDYPSLIKTIIRLFTESISIILCRVLKVRIMWICHNVDRESSENHPIITALRRKIIARNSCKIFVTDPGILKYGKDVFFDYNFKIDYITYGRNNINAKFSQASLELTRLISGYIQGRKNINNSSKLFFGLCSGTANTKTLSFELIPELIEKGLECGYSICMIVVGPIGTYLKKKNPMALNWLKSDPRVFFVDKYIYLEEAKIAEKVDFYWRAYNDISVPYTIYNAAIYSKPVLALKSGFVAEFVEVYSLGAVLEKDFSNLSLALDKLQRWDGENVKDFLESHNWDIAASQLAKAMDENMLYPFENRH